MQSVTGVTSNLPCRATEATENEAAGAARRAARDVARVNRTATRERADICENVKSVMELRNVASACNLPGLLVSRKFTWLLA